MVCLEWPQWKAFFGGKGPEEMRFFVRRRSLFFSVKEEKKLTAKYEKPFNGESRVPC